MSADRQDNGMTKNYSVESDLKNSPNRYR